MVWHFSAKGKLDHNHGLKIDCAISIWAASKLWGQRKPKLKLEDGPRSAMQMPATKPNLLLQTGSNPRAKALPSYKPEFP